VKKNNSGRHRQFKISNFKFLNGAATLTECSHPATVTNPCYLSDALGSPEKSNLQMGKPHIADLAVGEDVVL